MNKVVRRSVIGVVVCAVVALTAGAGTLVAMSKTVSISVDGEVTQVATLSGDVAGALADAGITVNDHDTLAPNAGRSISDGSRIVLERGRLVTLTVDGAQQEWWTTATTVDAALAEMGRGEDPLQLSADRSRSIPVGGLVLTAQVLHPVTVLDGAGSPITQITTLDTVGEVLDQAGVQVGDDDIVTPALDAPVREGLTVTVDRVTYTDVTKSKSLPQPADEKVKDNTLYVGIKRTTQQGSAGTELIHYRKTLVNGEVTKTEEISREVSVEPVATVVRVGTKKKVVKPAYTTEGSRVLFNDHEFGVNWDGLAFCESTNNPKAVDPTGSWYGMFQFDFSTWATVGGTGNPADASPTEQLMRAKLLYQSRGLEPWLCAHAA